MLVLATQTLVLVAATRNWKNLIMINGIGISLKAGGSRPMAIRTCSNIGKQIEIEIHAMNISDNEDYISKGTDCG
jgi:hypothetical protein